jgi:ribosomal-protein-alanine N-acetyltransferase
MRQRYGFSPYERMMGMRYFTEDDLNDVMHISEIAFGKSFDPHFYLSISEAWPDGFMVHEEKGKVVGFIAGHTGYATEAKILMLAVHPDMQGMGIGSALIRSFIDSCSMKAIKRIYLEVRVSNKNAIKLYEKHGFSRGTVQAGYYEDGEDALIMWKSL